MEDLKPCPFCEGKAKIQVYDDEGNLRNEDYKKDPWSGLSYAIVHDDKENKGCPIANFHEDGGVIGTLLYDSEEELIAKWNERV
ncbi:hypothetical protein OPHB3_1985 [Oceanobacillus picturae]|uniref:Uncharacterized protein n=1 Tax=Oceanobacillus picturae TaxID=171693 RepID=A0A0U9H5V9_9BACI|nr:hypothetical protein [Oceanobacillus picturae]GAQ18046.1 hypothetical protein OPHB3_1985 [Oceanobacillus picturae]